MAGIKQVKVDVNDLIIGMYVSGLDRPWSQTPFPLQGFHIRSLDEIDQLRLYCKYVAYVCIPLYMLIDMHVCFTLHIRIHINIHTTSTYVHICVCNRD